MIVTQVARSAIMHQCDKIKQQSLNNGGEASILLRTLPAPPRPSQALDVTAECGHGGDSVMVLSLSGLLPALERQPRSTRGTWKTPGPGLTRYPGIHEARWPALWNRASL